ncbi:MAG: hypothetical protein D6685_06395 [Bacteroidetes bacterium]|nr:MAG: hypothetical protein D6685_06395 [Bacteroidota bacterium]
MTPSTPTPRSAARPSPGRLLRSLTLGGIAGAAFGVFFGAFASVFQGGPELLVGVQESWGWFAVMGACMGLGTALTPNHD